MSRGGAPEISLGQKYLTTADPFDPNYNTPDQHHDLKKLTCPTEHELSTVMMRLIGFHPKIKRGREEGIKGQNYTTHGNNFFLYAILYM